MVGLLVGGLVGGFMVGLFVGGLVGGFMVGLLVGGLVGGFMVGRFVGCLVGLIQPLLGGPFDLHDLLFFNLLLALYFDSCNFVVGDSVCDAVGGI